MKVSYKFFISVIFMISFNALADDIQISQEAARKIVAVADYGSHNITSDYYIMKSLNSDFFDFEHVIGDTGYGFYAVNKWTGDVWSTWGCEKIHTPASDKLLVQIRNNDWFKKPRQYKELSALQPFCISDP